MLALFETVRGFWSLRSFRDGARVRRYAPRMRLRRTSAVALPTVLLLSLPVAAAQAKAPAVVAYKNCTAVHAHYKGGIAKVGAKDVTDGTSNTLIVGERSHYLCESTWTGVVVAEAHHPRETRPADVLRCTPPSLSTR